MFILRNSEILHLILLFFGQFLLKNFAVFIYAHKYNFRFSFFLPQNKSAQAIIYIPGCLSSKKLIRTQMVKAMAEM